MIQVSRHQEKEGRSCGTRTSTGVDAWETTYLHVLSGPDPVVERVRGTALRPVLAMLDDAHTEEFLAEYRDRMRQAYPPRPFGAILPFRRVLVVVHRPGSTSAERGAPAVRSGD
jgi:trans-aconitate 2-methyltransferase